MAQLKEPHGFLLLMPKTQKTKGSMHENGVRCCKVKKLKALKASGTTINADCCINGNGSYVLGSDFHLESSSIRLDCVIKRDSHCKKHKMARTHGMIVQNIENSLIFILKNAMKDL